MKFWGVAVILANPKVRYSNFHCFFSSKKNVWSLKIVPLECTAFCSTFERNNFQWQTHRWQTKRIGLAKIIATVASKKINFYQFFTNDASTFYTLASTFETWSQKKKHLLRDPPQIFFPATIRDGKVWKMDHFFWWDFDLILIAPPCNPPQIFFGKCESKRASGSLSHHRWVQGGLQGG